MKEKYLFRNPLALRLFRCSRCLSLLFGFSLFYLRSVAPAEIKTSEIYRGVAPFVVIQLALLLLLALQPALVTWLPSVL
ncbi:MAG: TRAP transporter large permease subunit [Gammaproteobacteria bacterium]|nr:TRAP transporter large permease subunit [Gammaproteobacteria bacterium]